MTITKGIVIDLYEEEEFVEDFINKLKKNTDILQHETSYYMTGCSDGKMLVVSDRENVIKRIEEIFECPIVEINLNDHSFDYDYRRDLH